MATGPVIYKRMMNLANMILENAGEQTSDAVDLAELVTALNERLISQPDFPREWVSF